MATTGVPALPLVTPYKESLYKPIVMRFNTTRFGLVRHYRTEFQLQSSRIAFNFPSLS